MLIRDVAWGTFQERGTIRRGGKKGSGKTVQAAQHDDDEENPLTIYCKNYNRRRLYMWSTDPKKYTCSSRIPVDGLKQAAGGIAIYVNANEWNWFILNQKELFLLKVTNKLRRPLHIFRQQYFINWNRYQKTYVHYVPLLTDNRSCRNVISLKK